MTTHSRQADGRYVVRLPFISSPATLGESKTAALASYERLEKRLTRDANLAPVYHEFLAEYRDLGHISLVSSKEHDSPHAVYLPHHPVVRLSSLTTKLRVVFNASNPTSQKRSVLK